MWSGAGDTAAEDQRRFTLGANSFRESLYAGALAQQHSPQVAHLSARDRQQTDRAAAAHAELVDTAAPLQPAGATAVRRAMAEAAPVLAYGRGAGDDAKLAILEAVRQRELELEQELLAEIAKAEAEARAQVANVAATPAAGATEGGAVPSHTLVAPVATLALKTTTAGSHTIVVPQVRRLRPSPADLHLAELKADVEHDELCAAFVSAVQRTMKGIQLPSSSGEGVLDCRGLDNPVADHLSRLEAQREEAEARANEAPPPVQSPHKFRPLFAAQVMI
jgi:hypothetical protein